jgi:DNA-binding MarR family transcriptional regulator
VQSRIVGRVDQVQWLSRRELRVWRLLAAVLGVLPDMIEEQLQRDGELTQFGYGVLSILSEAPGRAMRMSELAFMAYGSQSRLSHAMAGFERRGWVRRERAADDGRGNIAVLTDAGFAQVKTVAAGHVQTVRSAVFDALSARQLDELEGICAALLPTVIREQMLSHQNEDEQGRAHAQDTGLAATHERPDRVRADDEATHSTTQRNATGDQAATPAGALTQLLSTRDTSGSTPTPDPVDALTLLSEARRDIDFAELELIDRARDSGHTWEQIAAALAMPDRRQAQTRYRRLRERWPQYQPPASA